MVSTETAQAFAKEFGIQLIETSAKESTNVEQAFLAMSSEIKQKAAANPGLAGKGGNTIKPGEGKQIGAKSGCC